MELTKITPLGPRVGYGTYETFFDTVKYKSMEEAKIAYDVAIVDFVKDEYGTIYFQVYSSLNPDEIFTHRLNHQQFPFGVDISDDREVCNLVAKIFGKKVFDPSMN